MRWDNLTLSSDQDALFGVDRVVERTFDTPEFRGMTFYEVRARSIINRVPSGSRMPFSWTINPYRGCSHACRYCLVGETPILLADGLPKPLAELCVGDAIYGTVRRGSHRRFAVTEVLAHWRTVKRAYRVTLQDGTELVASGDHRFLTDRGWKHVVGATPGDRRRPQLTTHDELVGTRGFPHEPEAPVDARLPVVSVADLGVDVPMYDITTGTGDFIANGVVSHNCFARNTHEYLDLDAGQDFDSKVVVKVTAPELVRMELARPRWAGEHIAMGTNVDCYQRAEGRYRLMPGILAALRDAANPFSILTKGTLVLRDLDLLREAAEVTDVTVNVSVGSVDRQVWRDVEPGTPAPQARLGVCRALTDAGIGCGVLMAPVLPYLTDSPEQLDATVRAIAEAGARSVSPLVLHLRPGAREWYLGWLQRAHPELVGPYRELYGRGAYAPKSYQRGVTDQVARLARRYGVGRASPDTPGTPAHARPG
ncbi:MAG: Rv2578c family radical SAM protein [Pseudonocardiaceae bacterium]